MKTVAKLALVLFTFIVAPNLAWAQTDTSMVVTSIGNVGIGTVNPEHMVHVFGTGFTTLNQPIFKAETNGGQFGPQLRLKHNGPDGQDWLLVSGGSGNAQVQAGNLGFVMEGAAPSMVLNSNGNIGVGTNSPLWDITVQEASPFGTWLALANTSDGGNTWSAISSGSGNTEGAGKFLIRDEAANAARLTIDAAGQVGIGNVAPSSSLDVGSFSTARDNHITTKVAGGNRFRTGLQMLAFNEEIGYTVEYDERGAGQGDFVPAFVIKQVTDDPEGLPALVIRGPNFIGFGGVRVPNHPLEMASGAHVTAGGVWTDASSRDLKENINDLSADEALATLLQLNPKQYNYIRDEHETYLGFIAEDVPDLVAMNNRKSLSSMDIVAVLTKVVQQQQAQIDELKARVNAHY
ncbi:MAG: tail fiber domain-containing protein [Bacteroidota bacterium]